VTDKLVAKSQNGHGDNFRDGTKNYSELGGGRRDAKHPNERRANEK